MEDSQIFNYAVTASIVLCFAAVQYVQARRRNVRRYFSYVVPDCALMIRKQIKVPAIGPSGLFTSYYGGYKWLFNAEAIIQEGYNKVRQLPYISLGYV